MDKKANQILQRIKAYVGMHVLVYTAPASEAEGKLLEILNGWLVIEDDSRHVTAEGYKGGLVFVPVRRIVQFRAYFPEPKKAAKKTRRKAS